VAPRSEDPRLIIRVINFKLVQPICSAYRNVTDRQTDGRTDGRLYDSNTALALRASRGKKMFSVLFCSVLSVFSMFRNTSFSVRWPVYKAEHTTINYYTALIDAADAPVDSKGSAVRSNEAFAIDVFAFRSMNAILKIYEYNIRTYLLNYRHGDSEISRKKSTLACLSLCVSVRAGCVLFSACSISLCGAEIVSIDGASKAGNASIN